MIKHPFIFLVHEKWFIKHKQQQASMMASSKENRRYLQGESKLKSKCSGISALKCQNLVVIRLQKGRGYLWKSKMKGLRRKFTSDKQM